ncbi:hypothetical protein TVAG_334070 [Trichomonas vaginalis G3]|uniref:DUF3447 domain-containing protein n=1 Tax=Trichomonas vaginalis (strain ATCC PRA-98 / G3) TaxID=412133 RepID=A2EIB3_TRIV3|nr:spectrin binding [Trichomonas vaginalis G3]EAY07595.1 hypothetical protein TVAG_334070 [Trichomonas vaginalis G3]KAI5541963.1 spectrin binding [Trichomonas vaginalis G3]|eukprot:XP_001319818.1 hypothetical protein [Trichomonas vaginalis G3]
MNDDLKSCIIISNMDYFDIKPKIISYYLRVNLRTKEDYSLLDLCCYYGAVNCFKFLRTKCNLQISSNCLSLSFLSGKPDILNECLKFHIPDNECMRYAIASHNIDFVTFLVNEYDLEIQSKDCIEFNNIQAFFVYLYQINDIERHFIDSLNFNSQSLLQYISLLGVDFNNINSRYNSERMFHNAVKNCSADIVEFLISHGADVNSTLKYFGRAPLHIAVEYNKKDVAELLLLHGANVGSRFTKNGKTALYIAIENNRMDIVKLLLLHGANIEKIDNNRTLALRLAVQNDFLEFVEFLISNGADIRSKNIGGDDLLHIAIQNNCVKTAKYLISKGIDINTRDSFDNRTPLQQAVWIESLELVELLISLGSDINVNEENAYFAWR